jgi:putative Holliday junction resolvase
MDGSEGPRAKLTRDFALACEQRFQLPLHFQDERLTSHAAESSLNRSGRTHAQKRRIRDALAACELLKDFLAARA